MACSEDIGQLSWTSAHELRGVCAFIKQNDDIADFWCATGGLLTFIVTNTGCRGAGCDITEPVLQVARVRAEISSISTTWCGFLLRERTA